MIPLHASLWEHRKPSSLNYGLILRCEKVVEENRQMMINGVKNERLMAIEVNLRALEMIAIHDLPKINKIK